LPQVYSIARPGRKPAVAPEVSPLPAPQTNGHPRTETPPVVQPVVEEVPVAQVVNEAGDDRDHIQPGDPVLLIVENDLGFAHFLLDAAREKGFKGLVTSLGAAALALAREYMPAAVTLDIFLPDIEGWRVLERLKNDLATRHIPVCVVSTDEARERALNSGALAFVAKPVQTRDVLDQMLGALMAYRTEPARRLVVVEPDAERREQILAALAADDVRLDGVADEPAAQEALRQGKADCVVVGPGLPVPDCLALVEDVRSAPGLRPAPVILYQPGSPPAEEEDGELFKQLARAGTVRRVHSPERLLDQAAFFLHCDVAQLPEAARRQLEDLHSSERTLPGKKVLIVDDDMRNIFALSSVLEEHDMEVVAADNGRDAIQTLRTRRDIDIVLMDIMMPEMDGLDTMREIRKIPQLRSLPIIAVTAKAMKGDREKCIEAGAWDYLSKPVDAEQMLAVLRGWLHR
jgi:CheY-like chemotaxis protein